MSAADSAPAPGSRRFTRVLSAACLLLALDIALRTGAYARVRRWLAVSGRSRGADDPIVLLERGRLTMDRTLRDRLYPVRCLARSLALQHWLQRQGIGTELRVGVARHGDRLKAHAWIEYGGQPVGDTGVADRLRCSFPAA